MTDLYKKLREFFEEDFTHLQTIVTVAPSNEYAVIEFRPNFSTATHMLELSPRLRVSGGVLHNTTGTPQTITFSVEYPDPAQPEPNLIVDIYISDDGTSYTLDTSVAYDSLPATITTDKEYIVGIIRTDDTNPIIVYSTDDWWRKELYPIDPRYTRVELITYDLFAGNVLKGTFPVFIRQDTGQMIVDFTYRGIDSFTDSTLQYASGDAVNVESWDDTLTQMVLVGQYYLGDYSLPRENLFQPGSTKLLLGAPITQIITLTALVDLLVLLAGLSTVDEFYKAKFEDTWAIFTSLSTEPTTDLLYSLYSISGEAASTTVDIAANAYLALRFLSSDNPALVDYVTQDNGGQTFLDKLGDLVSIPDGYLLYDSYDGTTYENTFRGFTEGIFYLLERLVETEYPTLTPSSFSSEHTLDSLITYVDTTVPIAYCSAKERDGDSNAPDRNSLDLAALHAAIASVPITQTEDYSTHVGVIAANLVAFKVTNSVGISVETDPNNPNYNPYWVVAPPIIGLKYKESDGEIDTKISYLAYMLSGLEDIHPQLGDMSTNEGVLYVDQANVTDEKYVVPNLHSTVLETLSALSASFIKTTTYTVQVLDNIPNNASVVQVPTNQGVSLDITLDYPSGVVILAVGDSSGTTYDSVIIDSELTFHTAYIRIPVVSENIKIYVLPTRPTTVTS